MLQNYPDYRHALFKLLVKTARRPMPQAPRFETNTCKELCLLYIERAYRIFHRMKRYSTKQHPITKKHYEGPEITTLSNTSQHETTTPDQKIESEK